MKRKIQDHETEQGTRPAEDETLRFLKRLWRGEETLCPKCGKANLTYLHKKAKKSDCDWKCPACGEIYRTISILLSLKR